MKIFITFFLIIITFGYFFLNKKTQQISPRKIKREINKKVGENKTTLKDKPGKRYLSSDYNPKKEVENGLPIKNSINQNIKKLIISKLNLSGESRVELEILGNFLLIEGGFGRHLVKIAAVITQTEATPHVFTAFADAETGEVIKIIENSEDPHIQDSYNNGREDLESALEKSSTPESTL